jgi:flagellar assembly factor FliW
VIQGGGLKAVQDYDRTTQLKLKSKEAVIHFDEGLIGFSECKDFILMENESLVPFRLLQSLEFPNIGFLVLEPTALINNYYERVPEKDWESLGVGGMVKPLAFVIVVIGQTAETSTGNLQAPLLVNYHRMTGKQVILTDSGFSVRHPLTQTAS